MSFNDIAQKIDELCYKFITCSIRMKRNQYKTGILYCWAFYVLFSRNSKLLCIWVIKLRILHRMKLMAVIMMTRQCHVVWVKLILRSAFIDYRCNGRFIHLYFIDNSFIVSEIRLKDRQENLRKGSANDDWLRQIRCRISVLIGSRCPMIAYTNVNIK